MVVGRRSSGVLSTALQDRRTAASEKAPLRAARSSAETTSAW
jgi:hypothetical protein